MPNIKFYINQTLERKFMDHMRSDNAQNPIESKMKRWMRHEDQLAHAETLWDLKQIMRQDSYFGENEELMVNDAYTQFLEDWLAEVLDLGEKTLE